MKFRFCIIVCIASGACTSNKKQNMLNFFDKINHIPVDIESLNVDNCDDFDIIYPAAMEYSGFCGIYFSHKMSIAEFKTDSIAAIKNAKSISFVYDSSNFYVGDDNLKLRSIKKDVIPLPSIKNSFSPLKDFFLINDSSKFVVLDFKKGYFFKEKYEIKDIHMPQSLDHGYCYGLILTNNQHIIHWLIIW